MESSLFITNVYRNPKHQTQKLNTLQHTASTQFKDNTLLMEGYFNATHPAWGYVKEMAKEWELLQDSPDHNCALTTDPAHLTRIGNSEARHTTPDLKFIHNDHTGLETWHNTGVDLGSEHYILEITIPNQLQGSTNSNK